MMTKLSDTARVILSRASQHTETLAEAPANLPTAARVAVIGSMLKHGLLEEVPAPREHAGLAWRQGADGAPIALRITAAGLRAIGIEPAPPAGEAARPSEPERDLPVTGQGDSLAASGPRAPCDSDGGLEPAVAAPVAPGVPAPRSPALRLAAVAVLAAWDDETGQRADLPSAIDALRVVLAKSARTPRQASDTARSPRTGTKQEAVLALLRRAEGASGPAMAEATGWAPHTVRGFLAGLAKRGMRVEVLERVRQVGPGKAGAKGSYTIYRIAEAG